VSDLPRITIIVTVMEQSERLTDVISSILDQNYPAIELIVIDGSQSDRVKQIIDSCKDRLTWTTHQRFQNLSEAVNKGFDKATGDLMTWLDDRHEYLPGALSAVGESFRDSSKTDFLYGASERVDAEGTNVGTHCGNIFKLEELLDLWNVWWQGRNFGPSECFWSRRMFLKVRSFREDLVHAFAYEYWTRLFQAGARVQRLDRTLVRQIADRNPSPAESRKTAQRREELQVIEPILWNPTASLDSSIRRRLQADWLFETELKAIISDSREAGDTLWQCRLKLIPVLFKNPKAAFSEQLRHRLAEFD